MSNKLTVGKLRSFLVGLHPDTEITFGSSKYSKRPLIYYRFKRRGENLLQIELNEIDEDFDTISEIDCRETVELFLEQLEGVDDEVEITFGSSKDAVPLRFRSLSMVVGINLEQTNEPNWIVRGD